MRVASCVCGRLKASCEGEPVRVSVCHCLNCQQRTGTAFALTSRWPKERVTFSGDANEYQLTGDEGSTATFRFCPTCAGTVYFTNAPMPDLIAIPVGMFRDPAFPAPSISIYENRKHAWLDVDAPGMIHD